MTSATAPYRQRSFWKTRVAPSKRIRQSSTSDQRHCVTVVFWIPHHNSSLAYLKQLPVDQIKVDKSFITNLANDHNDQAIVRATLTLAQNLGLLVVVEGVEDSASWKLLKSMNCHAAQGYYLSHPMPSQDYVAFVKKFEMS